MNALAQSTRATRASVLSLLAMVLVVACGLIATGGCEGVRKQPGLFEMIAGEPEISLSVMSFNIRYDNPADGENGWARRAPLVAQAIRDHRADIVGLQEALSNQLQDLLAELPEYEAVGVGRDDGKASGEYAAILYKRERLRLDAATTFWLSPTPQKPGSRGWGANLPRICTTATFGVYNSGRAVRVFNVHFDHESQRAREESAHLLAKAISDARQINVPVIVTGDFNAGEQSGVIAYLTGRAEHATAGEALAPGSPRLLDTFRIKSTQTEGTGTYHGWTGDASGERIDFILVDRSLEVVSAGIDTPMRSAPVGEGESPPPARYPSDHFPIFATVTIPGHAK